MNIRTLSTLLLSAACVVSSANLLVNGDFEAGSVDADQSGFTADGWIFSPTARFACRAVPSDAYDGIPAFGRSGRILDFNAADTPAGSTASQSFASLTGTIYGLSLEYAQYSAASGVQQLTAIITDNVTSQTIATYRFPSPLGTRDVGKDFSTGGFSFLGTGNALTLTLTDAGSDTVSTDLLVDNVSIVARPVPEPASLAAVSLAAFTLLRRKGRRL